MILNTVVLRTNLLHLSCMQIKRGAEGNGKSLTIAYTNCGVVKLTLSLAFAEASSSPPPPPPPPDLCSSNFSGSLLQVHDIVKRSGKPNFLQAHIPIQSQLKVGAWEEALGDYWDKQLIELIKFGFPLDFTVLVTLANILATIVQQLIVQRLLKHILRKINSMVPCRGLLKTIQYLRVIVHPS